MLADKVLQQGATLLGLRDRVQGMALALPVPAVSTALENDRLALFNLGYREALAQRAVIETR